MHLSREEGSLPLALLAVLVVGALVSVLMATVLAGQRNTRFDERYEQAHHVAEIGLDRLIALTQMGAADGLAIDDEFGPLCPNPSPTPPACPEIPPPGEYVARARRVDRLTWHIVSTGSTAEGVLRTVEVEVGYPPTWMGAAGRQSFASGAQAFSDAYDSRVNSPYRVTTPTHPSMICDEDTWPAPGTVTPFPSNTTQVKDVRMCHPADALARFATNGVFEPKGGTMPQVDAVEIHNSRYADDPRSDATGDCKPTHVCSHEVVEHHRDPLVFPAVEDPVDVAGDVIQPDVGHESFPSPGNLTPQAWWEAHTIPDSPDDPLRRPACTLSDAALELGKTSCLGPGVHVFENVLLDFSVDFQGEVDDPVVLYVTGQVVVPEVSFGYDPFDPDPTATSPGVVNFQYNGTHWEPRPPASLLIRSRGGGPSLNFGRRSSFSGVVYAPHAAFHGTHQANFYGALIANSISSGNNHWRFHFDMAVEAMDGRGPRYASRWAEVVRP